ncbi:MAG: lipoyl(octanoyl) transferase LipB [Candidatus Thermoplasmatota archaeon]|nr:lipoyl(octanoyl) transferase LipB [Candidatus Thermoplasmatota archaeon]
MLDVRILGEVAYEEAQTLMKDLQQQRIEGTIPDTLLILSHPEVVTVGPRARNDGIQPPADYPTVAVDRGGGLTWHGPGQVVGYPVVKWGDRKGEASVADVIHIIEGWLIETLATFGVVGVRDERMQGVWVNGRKVCSIGLSFLRWVSRHGFSVNLNTPVGRVEGVAGCGLAADTTTSLRALGHDIHPEDFVQALLPVVHRTLGTTSENR